MDRPKELVLGDHWSYNLRNDPKRLGFVLSRYSFAAKLTCKGIDVLELGCSEGIGVSTIRRHANSYVGVDLDAEAIEAARRNWGSDSTRFVADDFLGKRYGSFGSVISFDVVEHIDPADEAKFFETVHANLNEDGTCVVGTPNANASPYSSLASQIGHVNLFSAERLVGSLERFFHNVFLFSMNDEVVHTGFSALAHFLIAMGCYKK